MRADDVTSAGTRPVTALIGELATLPRHVIDDPYPQGFHHAGQPDPIARVYLDVTNPNDMPVEDIQRLLAAANGRAQRAERRTRWARGAGRRANQSAVE